MAILGEIRKRPWILITFIAVALLAFLVNPNSLDKFISKNPNVLGKVNGEKIFREDFEDQIFILQQQYRGRSRETLEEEAWQTLVQSKLIKQEFDKTGLSLNEDVFWNQLQYDPMFAQNPRLFDEKGNFKAQELKKEIEDMKAQSPENYSNWLRMRKSIEYRMMARQVFSVISSGITSNEKEAIEIEKEKKQFANIDYVRISYDEFARNNKVRVTTKHLEDYIKKHPSIFKVDDTRNIGVVSFPAEPTEKDEISTRTEIENLLSKGVNMGNGIESFQKTKNDSMFVMVNSDVPFNSQYLPLDRQLQDIRNYLKTSPIGKTFGPYKVQNRYFVVSKLLDKRPTDSVRSRHILISYKGSPADNSGLETRTKEEAKKLADSIATVVRTNVSKFADLVKFSSDLGSASNGGELGWSTQDTPFVPEFKAYLAKNKKGETGVVETQYGFHIINIQDKRRGSMRYKVANLVKEIKTSEETTNNIYNRANGFIQDIQGKSFNDFKNIAENSKYIYANPTRAKRFQGQIAGINTDKDSDVLAWAFDKKTKIGETNIFNTSDGGYVVAYLNGIQKAGIAEPESVRSDIESTVRNQLLAKRIIEKINTHDATSLAQIAKLFGEVESGKISVYDNVIAGRIEPKVAGAAFGVKANQISKPVEGTSGVYVVVRKSVEQNPQEDLNTKKLTKDLTEQRLNVYGQSLLRSLENKADIQDYRIEVYNKSKF